METPFFGDTHYDAIRYSLKTFQNIALTTTKGHNGFYQLSIDPDGKYRMSPEDWQHSLRVAEEFLGYVGQPRIVVKHVKYDSAGQLREHIHVIWQRARIREDGTFTPCA